MKHGFGCYGIFTSDGLPPSWLLSRTATSSSLLMREHIQNAMYSPRRQEKIRCFLSRLGTDINTEWISQHGDRDPDTRNSGTPLSAMPLMYWSISASPALGECLLLQADSVSVSSLEVVRSRASSTRPPRGITPHFKENMY